MKELLEDYEKRGLVYSQQHPTLDLKIYNYTDKVQYESLWDDITMLSRALVIDGKGDIVARP
nr:MAG TPA: RNA ligase [Caudoviricetes sp.]